MTALQRQYRDNYGPWAAEHIRPVHVPEGTVRCCGAVHRQLVRLEPQAERGGSPGQDPEAKSDPERPKEKELKFTFKEEREFATIDQDIADLREWIDAQMK